MLPAGPARARALLLLGEVRFKSDSFPAAREVLEQARDEIGDREPDRVMLELRLAYVLCNLGLRAPAAELTCAALAHARALEEPALLAQALAVSVMLDFNLGRGLDEARLAEALELEVRDRRMTDELQPSLIAALLFLWIGRFGEASALLDAMAARSEDHGETHSLVWNAGLPPGLAPMLDGRPRGRNADRRRGVRATARARHAGREGSRPERADASRRRRRTCRKGPQRQRGGDRAQSTASDGSRCRFALKRRSATWTSSRATRLPQRIGSPRSPWVPSPRDSWSRRPEECCWPATQPRP